MTRQFGAAFWPDERQTLLLRAALRPDGEAWDAWERLGLWAGGGRLDRGSERLLPLVYANLRRTAPGPLALATGERGYRETLARNTSLFEAAGGLLRGLGGAGIATLALKGWPLAVRYYGDVGLRPMADVDVLVTAPDLPRAVAILQRFGWSPKEALTPAYVLTRHAMPFVGAGRHQCDLHWRFFEESCPADAEVAFWSASLPVDLGGAQTRMLSPADQLLHVCVHGAKWSRVPGIRWVADAVIVLRAESIDWSRLVAQAATRRFVLRARLALGYLRAAMDAPVPEEVLRRLGELPVSTLERLECRVRGREQRLLGSLPFHCLNFLRARVAAGTPIPTGLVRYLQAVWGIGTLGQVPWGAAVRAARRVRAVLR